MPRNIDSFLMPSVTSFDAVPYLSPGERAALLEDYGLATIQSVPKKANVLDATILLGEDVLQKNVRKHVQGILKRVGLAPIESADSNSTSDKNLALAKSMMFVGTVAPDAGSLLHWATAHAEFAIPPTDQSPEEIAAMLNEDAFLAVVSADERMFLARALDRSKEATAAEARNAYQEVLRTTTTSNNNAGHAPGYRPADTAGALY